MKTGIISILILVFTTGLLPVYALANKIPDIAEVQAAWANEPPLTQADIDSYVKILSQLMDIARAEFDREAFLPVFEQAGWNVVHGSYVLAKMNMALTLLEVPELEAKFSKAMPKNALPTAAEKELVRQNLNRIEQCRNAYVNSISNTP